MRSTWKQRNSRQGRQANRAARATRGLTLGLCALALLLFSAPAMAGPYADPGYPITQMQAWASAVDGLARGPVDIAQPALGSASYGAPADVLGAASGDTTTVLSLGDGGSITLFFDSGIGDDPGADFAVFENGFWTEFGLFAEFAYVEVSSNGTDFARFDPVSLAPVPVPGGSEVDPSDYYDLAGDQAAGLGTGFDLAELAGDPLVAAGLLDLQAVQNVRLIDVVGDGSTFDSTGAPIYDPYPTPFASSGFDLDGVGVLHTAVPEPAATAMLALGLLGLFVLYRRRERTRGAAGSLGAHLRQLAPAALGEPSRCLAAAVTLALLAIAPSLEANATITVDFEDLGLGVESHWDGSDLSGGYTSRGVGFENVYNTSWSYWYGFAASTTTDTTTPGFGNQWSAFPGAGAGGSATYGLFFDDAAADPRLTLSGTQSLMSVDITNTTYAYLSMRDGDSFAKQFGGPSGNDPDWFRLTINGYDAAGALAGSLDFYLADYRFADNALDTLIGSWTNVDLLSLGPVHQLGFALASSDTSGGYMNTPGYFALDNLVVVPEPATGLLLAAGLLGLARVRHRDKCAERI